MQNKKNTNFRELSSESVNTIKLKPVYDILGILQMVPIGRSKLYEEIKSGRLRHSKMGRKTLFLLKDVLSWLEAMNSYSNIGKDHE